MKKIFFISLSLFLSFNVFADNQNDHDSQLQQLKKEYQSKREAILEDKRSSRQAKIREIRDKNSKKTGEKIEESLDRKEGKEILMVKMMQILEEVKEQGKIKRIINKKEEEIKENSGRKEEVIEVILDKEKVPIDLILERIKDQIEDLKIGLNLVKDN